MPNPKGINQYTGGKGAGTFRHGTKSANSSGRSSGSSNTRKDALRSAKLAAKRKKR